MEPDAWAKERFGRFSIDSTDWAELRGAIEKICTLTKKCTYEEKKLLRDITLKVKSLQSVAAEQSQDQTQEEKIQ